MKPVVQFLGLKRSDNSRMALTSSMSTNEISRYKRATADFPIDHIIHLAIMSTMTLIFNVSPLGITSVSCSQVIVPLDGIQAFKPDSLPLHSIRNFHAL